MNKMMSISLAGLLSLLCSQAAVRAQDSRKSDSAAPDAHAPPLQRSPHQLPAEAPGGVDAINQPKSVREIDMALSELENENTARKKALESEYEERRRDMIGSQEYKSLGRRERKAKLRALKNEYRVREQQLNDEYRSKRDEFGRQRESLPDDGTRREETEPVSPR